MPAAVKENKPAKFASWLTLFTDDLTGAQDRLFVGAHASEHLFVGISHAILQETFAASRRGECRICG